VPANSSIQARERAFDLPLDSPSDILRCRRPRQTLLAPEAPSRSRAKWASSVSWLPASAPWPAPESTSSPSWFSAAFLESVRIVLGAFALAMIPAVLAALAYAIMASGMPRAGGAACMPAGASIRTWVFSRAFPVVRALGSALLVIPARFLYDQADFIAATASRDGLRLAPVAPPPLDASRLLAAFAIPRGATPLIAEKTSLNMTVPVHPCPRLVPGFSSPPGSSPLVKGRTRAGRPLRHANTPARNGKPKFHAPGTMRP
jgi:hypothetical protein